jgi:regulator of sigma E protease
MIGFIQALLAFILALGLLITFHEFGHYWVARKCNVKILRFSIGFGKPLYKRMFSPDNSEFVIAALPLGGYVKMLDEREGIVAPQEAHRSFNSKPLVQRFAIVLAGPLFNFIFAIFAYWLMFVVGVSGLKPVIGNVSAGSLAEHAGLAEGDEIMRVGDKQTPTWSAVIDVFVARVIEQQQVSITVRNRNGSETEKYLDLSNIPVDDMAGGRLMTSLGIAPELPAVPAVIGKIIHGGAADIGGMQAGDRIVAVDGQPVRDWIEWVERVRASPGKAMIVEVLRRNDVVSLVITPELILENDAQIGQIGAAVDGGYRTDNSLTAVERYTVFEAGPRALIKTWDMSVMTLRILGKMITGEASVKNLSGPISIAQYAGYSAGLGIAVFLGFLAIVSVSLGILNLLPVPLLDGGHLFFYLVEFIKGSPVSETAQAIGQQVGLAVLLCLMGLAFYNDILRLVG